MGSQGLPVPAEAEGDRVQGVATLHHIVTTAHGLTLNHRRPPLVLPALHHLHATGRRTDATGQHGNGERGQWQAQRHGGAKQNVTLHHDVYLVDHSVWHN